MRQSNDEMKDGKVFNGFDYDLQVWVIEGRIQRCGHPEAIGCSCNGRKYENQLISEVK